MSPFAPTILIKLYLYEYQHSIRSSRKLARETQRNLEVGISKQSLTI